MASVLVLLTTDCIKVARLMHDCTEKVEKEQADFARRLNEIWQGPLTSSTDKWGMKHVLCLTEEQRRPQGLLSYFGRGFL